MVEIAGRRYCLWCLKNVPGDMQEQLNMLKILRALVGSAPAKRIAADRRIFPAGMLPIIGWLSHTQLLWHLEHVCVIRRREPLIVFLTSTDLLRQFRHTIKSRKRADSKTM